MATDLGIKALTFDVGGTLIDWHGKMRQELSLFGEKRGFERDWGEVTNSWTWSAIRALQAQKPPQLLSMKTPFWLATSKRVSPGSASTVTLSGTKVNLYIRFHPPSGHVRAAVRCEGPGRIHSFRNSSMSTSPG